MQGSVTGEAQVSASLEPCSHLLPYASKVIWLCDTSCSLVTEISEQDTLPSCDIKPQVTKGPLFSQKTTG